MLACQRPVHGISCLVLFAPLKGDGWRISVPNHMLGVGVKVTCQRLLNVWFIIYVSSVVEM